MNNGKASWAMIAAITLILLAISGLFQTYIFTSLEESYIFLYDFTYLTATLREPGGLAQVIASFFTQFMRFPWAGPLITSLIYMCIMICLVHCCFRRSPLTAVLASVPCVCLVLCLESSAYEYQGHVALLICALLLLDYALCARKANVGKRTLLGLVLTVFGYFMAGSAAIFASAGFIICDIANFRKGWYFGLLYPFLAVLAGWLCYEAGLVYTLARALTPAMYYDLNATSYMMLYALSAMALFMAFAYPSALKGARTAPRAWILSAAMFIAIGVVFVNIYPVVHGHQHYQNLQMRYYANNGQWDKITAMPYDGSATPFTSYRFLAMAKQGTLADHMASYRPFIDYFFKNKPLVKKVDQQALSDIYYQCDYMAAARKAAFDTDIVTPGAFNPVETKKLVAIQLAYGNYRIAEKLICQLEKTAFYGTWASDMRKYLDNDELVENDPTLGPKRRAIPEENHYLSPKGLQRELQYIVDSNPEQTVARQMLDAFLILTYQK